MYSSPSDKKEFDAFVSYAKWGSMGSEDEAPLSEEQLALILFPEVLENKYGFTLCLLERDVAPGGGGSSHPGGSQELRGLHISPGHEVLHPHKIPCGSKS